MRLLRLLCILGAVAAGGFLSRDADLHGGDGTQSSVAALINQLGDDDFGKRELATRQLMARRDAVVNLRQAMSSPDREVARRAVIILQHLDAGRDDRIHRQLAEGHLDLAIDGIVHTFDSTEIALGWGPLFRFVGDVCNRAGKDFPHLKFCATQDTLFPGGDITRFQQAEFLQLYPDRLDLGPYRTVVAEKLTPNAHSKLLIRGNQVQRTGRMFSASFFATSNIVRLGHLMDSVCFSNQDSAFQIAMKSLIICDGDLRLGSSSACIVIASGNIECTHGATHSLLIAGGSITLGGKPEHSRNNTLRENDRKPLGFIQFFDPARYGVRVEPAMHGVRVKELDSKKAFAAAGLRVGDHVTGLGDLPTDYVEQFRRVLRRRIAEGSDVVFKVRRGGQDLEVIVPVWKILPED